MPKEGEKIKKPRTRKEKERPSHKRASGKGAEKENKKTHLVVKVHGSRKMAKKETYNNAEPNGEAEKFLDSKKNEEGKAYSRPVILSEKTESEKRLLMWAGVGSVMVLILVLWIFQIKQTITSPQISASKQSESPDWKKSIAEISEAIKDMKENLSQISQYSGVSSTQNSASSSMIISTSTDIQSLNQATGTLQNESMPLPLSNLATSTNSSIGTVDVIDELIEKLEEKKQ